MTATSTFDNTKKATATVTVTTVDHSPIGPTPDPNTPIDLTRDFVQGFAGEYANLKAIRLNGVSLTLTATGPSAASLSGWPGYTPALGKAESGSVVVTLYKEFLQTLPSGKYTLEVEFLDGTVKSTGSVQFTVEAQAPGSSSSSSAAPPPPVQNNITPQNPQTGDTLNLWPLLALAAAALLGGGAAVLVKLRGEKKGAQRNSGK